jgi:hypothetical protein
MPSAYSKKKLTAHQGELSNRPDMVNLDAETPLNSTFQKKKKDSGLTLVWLIY